MSGRAAAEDWGSDPRLYSQMQPSPTRLIDDHGRYIPGWFESFDGELNTAKSAARWTPLQSWFHLQFVSARHLVVANIADLKLGGNVALLVYDRESGQLSHEAETRMLWRNAIAVDPMYRRFRDAATQSEIVIDEGLSTVEFHLRVGDMSLEGSARALFDRPFVQTTAYSDGRGTLQWWGCMETSGRVKVQTKTASWWMPEGTLGLYDRTLGHRRRRQNWNWLAVIGRTKEGAPFALQAAQDQGRAQPRRRIHKVPMWLDGTLWGPEGEARFDYRDPAPGSPPSAWSISLGEGPGAHASLRFEPQVSRREQKRLPGIVRADFRQHYGEVTGYAVGSRRVEFERAFAVCEDSYLAFL